MNSTDNRNSAEEEENEERSVKRVCFDLPPLPGKSRTDGTKRSLAARRQLELHYPTDDFAQSPLHEHFLGEIHFNRKDEQEYCVACISPTMNEPVGNPDKSIGPETETEPEPVSLDGPCGSSPTATEHSQEEEGPRPRKYRKLIAHEKTRLKDIIGHGAVKLRIDELLLPMGLPAAVANSVFTGIRSIPASILLHGPPGCGKVSV